MILQELNRYYQRLLGDPDVDIPILGFAAQKIHFCLVLDRQGRLVRVDDIREVQKEKPIPKVLVTPEAVKRSSGIAPNFLWDNTGYVLGADAKGKPERARQTFQAFKEYQHTIGDNVEDKGMSAVSVFLDTWQPEKAQGLEYWEEMAGANIVFRLDGDRQFVHDRPDIKTAWIAHRSRMESGVVGVCLVSGEQGPIARLHPSIKNVRGAQSSGAALVSFNAKAFLSYGKDQNFNAPVSEEIAFAYTTGLNHLLRRGSRQKVQIGDATTVFWTERESPAEGFLGLALDPGEDAGQLSQLRLVLEAVRTGKPLREVDASLDPDVSFYVLGLSPNASRLSVRFWLVSTVGDMLSNLAQHFSDLAIARSYESDPEYPAMWRLLKETAVQGKSENVSPVLAGAVMRSILTGTLYPQSLLSAVITRIRADQTINYLRAAMIKACLVRKSRRQAIPAMEVTMALDQQSTSIAYRLGRVFAVLEKAQKDAVPGANTTIKDRFYGSASVTPRVVFPQLLRLAQHHIAKAEYGRHTDRMIEDIMQGIEAFPAHLSLEDQGLFAIGYYHQRNAFFKRSSEEEEE